MRKIISKWCLGVSLVFIISCSSDISSKQWDADKYAEAMPLKSAKVVGNNLSFIALSNGCSKNTHFKVNIENIEEEQALIKVVRLHPDNCKRMPFLNTFSLKLNQELLGKTVKVVNPKLEFTGKMSKK